MKSKDLNAVKNGLHCIYDYCALARNDQDILNIKLMKKELFLMLDYSTGEFLNEVIETFKNILKNCQNIFTQEEYQLLQVFINEYLILIEKEKVSVNTLDDFSLVSNMAGFVTYLNRASDGSLDLNDWIDYIKNHRLPEVKKYSDILNN